MASAPSASNLRTKRYILAALAGIFTAATIIIIVSAILSPADIHFSIIDSSSSHSTQGVLLNLTLSANNTSHRAGVRYRTIFAYLEYINTAEKSIEHRLHKLTASNITGPSSQSPASKISIQVLILIPHDLWTKFFAGRNGTASAFRRVPVLVMAFVQFKVGPSYTRQHIIRVLCDPEDYFTGRRLSSPVNCSAA